MNPHPIPLSTYMIRAWRPALLLISLAILTAGIAAAQPTGMNLVWSDEFDYSGLPDESKWSHDVEGNSWAWGNNELQNYTPRDYDKPNAWVEDGKLIIEARKERYTHSGHTRDYTSARLRTAHKGDWLYGRFEIRAKLPKGRGNWAAIWMLPTDWEYGNWPDSGEIDIMEHVGYDMNRIHGTVHTKSFNHVMGTQVGTSIVAPEVDEQFHLYALEWRPDRIDVFLNDTLYFSFPNDEGDFASWPFNQRFHLLLNLAIGGNWGGLQGVDDSAFPQRMEVDYVRVYALEDPNSNNEPQLREDISAVHQFHNPTTGAYFFTAFLEEARDVFNHLPQWRYQGLSFEVEYAQSNHNQPVYRFFNRRSGSHFYTASADERDGVIANLAHQYTYEGIAFFVRGQEVGPDPVTMEIRGFHPIWRCYLPRTASHYFTGKPDEVAWIQEFVDPKLMYVEGVAWYSHRVF